MELLERDSYIKELGTLLQEAASGHGRLVFLGGEAGAGKTSLVQRFCQLSEQNTVVLLGACDPLSTPRPLGPLLDIAATVGGKLARLLDGGDHRERIFHTFLAALTGATRSRLVVFEDVHWADEATLDLLRFLGRRLSSSRTLLIATYRNDEVGPAHPLRIVLGDLATSSAIRRLALPPLSADAVRVLATGSGLDAVLLHRQTGGNPFFVSEVLASGGLGIPHTVRDAVLARAARLSPNGRTTLEASAVIGARVEHALLAHIAGPAAEAVDDCVAVGVLRPQGDALAFRHELVRETVLATMSPSRRVALHRAVLAAIQSSTSGSEDLARLAHHSEAAGDCHAVLTYAPAAARQAASLRAHREAAAQYARALRCAVDIAPEIRAGLLEARSYECYLTDQLAEALAARQEALDLWRTIGNRLKEGDNLRWLSRLLWFMGRNDQAEQAGHAALTILESLPAGPQLAMAFSNQAQLRMLAHDLEAAISWGQRAISLAEQVKDTETLIHALNNVGTTILQGGDDTGRALLQRSLRLAREANLEEHVARAYTNLGSAAIAHYQFDHGDDALEQGIMYSVDHDLDAWRLYMLGWRAVSYLHQGRWDEAAEAAAAVTHHPNVSPISRIQGLVVLGRVRARRGDPEAMPVLDEALALATPIGELQRLGPVRAARAEAAWLAGAPQQAAAEASTIFDFAAHHRQPSIAGELALWLWRAGHLTTVPSFIAEPYALHLAGDWATACSAWQRLGCPYNAAQALFDSPDEQALRQALAVFEGLDARPAAAAAAARLRELGARSIPRGPRPTTRANAAQLTRRELDVLQLIVEGLRNADIAQRLVLAPKTVDHHVSAVLSKLQVRTRTEAAREAARLGIVDPQNREPATPT